MDSLFLVEEPSQTKSEFPAVKPNLSIFTYLPYLFCGYYPHITSTSVQPPGFLWIDVQLMPEQVDVVHRQRARAISIDEAEDPFQAPLLPPPLGL